MSNKVDHFLSGSDGNNFTVTAHWPLALGEENKKESNGDISGHGSHNSQLSHTSGRSITSNKGDVNSTTPRNSNTNKARENMLCMGKTNVDDTDAPLGFEPEGSAANSPPFTESRTPPYMKWAKNLHCLLDDSDGVQLFRTFLDLEGIDTCSVDFWFACQGLKLKEKSISEVLRFIKIIHKKYIKSDKLSYLDLSVKQKINEKIRQLQIDHGSQSGLSVLVNIFNEVQLHVERYVKSDTYSLFLKSDLYIQYVSKEAGSPNSTNTSSGSKSARPLSSGPLPTLKEDQELQQDDFAVLYNIYGPPLINLKSNHYVHCDIKRLPDALRDGHLYIESIWHREPHHNKIQRQASQKKETVDTFIQKTERAPKNRKSPAVDCQKFADELIQRLLKVQKELEKEERINHNLSKVMNKSDTIEPMEKSSFTHVSSKNNTTSTSLALLTSSMMEQHKVDSKEENADSILEEHLSRIWAGSAKQTPSRSPGWHSPRLKSPERLHKSSQTQQHSSISCIHGTLPTKPLHKKWIEFYFMSLFDCGIGEDTNSKLETHKHIHHHDRIQKLKQKLDCQAQQHARMCWCDGTPWPCSSIRVKPANHNHCDVCSNMDCGISMMESIGRPHPDVAMSDPSTTK